MRETKPGRWCSGKSTLMVLTLYNQCPLMSFCPLQLTKHARSHFQTSNLLAGMAWSSCWLSFLFLYEMPFGSSCYLFPNQSSARDPTLVY
ncbi:hypothetical protein QR685DRAFT_574842 [Neurospora intermedia]|uniref:Uncharacterized protein n=1 Tax=Neurospora intermedia TaxID=5142 RepID=A0ABR3D242_NEUIN